MGIKSEYNHQSRTNKLRRCAASSSAAEFFISDFLNNEGRLLRSLTTRIDGREKTALFGWFDSMLKEQQLASFKVFLLALDIGSIAIEGYLGIQIIIKALEMKDTATSVRQLKLSAQYFAYGAAKLTMQVVDALLTFGDMVKTKKPDIEVDEIQSISRMNGVQEQTWNRSNTVGRNPSKSSATGREVIARMEREGRIFTNKSGARFFQDSRGVLRPLEEGDMSHITDAVTWWNHTGRYYGAKSPEVRAWMLDSKNYVIDYYSYNRAAGPRIGETYLPPLK